MDAERSHLGKTGYGDCTHANRKQTLLAKG